jgi:hypothetical protein
MQMVPPIQSPTSQPKQFASRHRTSTLVRNMNGRKTPMILAGEFNASLQHAPMHALLVTTTDAAQATAMKWCPTWPSGRSASTKCAVPLLDVDHVPV